MIWAGKRMNDTAAERIGWLRARIAVLDDERGRLVAELAALTAPPPAPPPAGPVPAVTSASSPEDKVRLFLSLFRGRTDVFPKRWENAKTGKSGYSPSCANEWVRRLCGRPKVKCGECPDQAFVPMSGEVVRGHLQGRFVAGVYPMLRDETTWFLAADFDEEAWARDALAVLATCRDKGVPAYLERSRSGNGGHVWLFFSEPVAASEARRLGTAMLTATMDRCPDLGFRSYDRLFPSQDTLPAGGFGNLIALPLQKTARERGNSLFVDDALEPFPDQWAFLSTVKRIKPQAVTALVGEALAVGGLLGVRMPASDEDVEPWTEPPSRRRAEPAITGPLPENLEIVLGDQLYVPRTGLPPALVSRLVRLAVFQNPEFYKAQAMRLPTFDKPRIISCTELLPGHIGLPRGCLDEAMVLLAGLGIGVAMRDERNPGRELTATFRGTLTGEQEAAASALLAHDCGILAATTAFGKTVVAAHLIAARRRNTLVLVHRQQLLDQWRARLASFLDLDPAGIGRIGGGVRRPTGTVDVALIQSLVRQGTVDDIVADYGHLVVDECHHLSAVSFELVARRCKARHVLGLTATVTRKDGHHPIILMQCGPVRHRVDARQQAAQRPFSHEVVFRTTAFALPPALDRPRPSIQDLYAALVHDTVRNDLIFNDVLEALEQGRCPVVITERKEHVSLLADRLSKFAKHVITLQGGLGRKQQRAVMADLAAVPEHEERVIVATGRYLGEGFDDARLDTLFLAMPISWRGTLAQYAGRLHRLHHAKRKVVIYDYQDNQVPMLARMAEKREAGYRSLGYTAGEYAGE